MAKKTLEENINQAVNDFKAIKAKIVEKGVPIDSGTPTSAYPQKIEGLFEAGKKAEHDAFWDGIARDVAPAYLFSGKGWNDTTFKPNKTFALYGNATYMFYGNGYNGDLVELCERQNITFDFSTVSNLSLAFAYSNFTHLGVIDLSNCTSTGSMFMYMQKLHTIDKIIINERVSCSRWFEGVGQLRNITFQGVIATSNLDFSQSPLLTKESTISTINAFSTTTSLTVKFSLIAVNNAFETAEGLADGSTSQEWLDLVATKPNLTISLA
jgi:hypothetical protein